VADPFHDFQGLQGLQGLQREEEEEEEMTGASAVTAAVGRPASAAVELDSGFVVQDGFIEEYPFADFSPEDPREFSGGGKHKRRYTKRRQKNTRTKKNKRNKKMTKRKKNK
jgi:hypothetical protein